MTDVATFYAFADLARHRELRAPLRELCEREGLLGTILLAHEGVNATVAGPRKGIEALLGRLRAEPGLESLSARWSTAEAAPFRRMKIRSRRELVSLGRPGVAPHRRTGERVAPEDWNDVLQDPGVIVLDVRNAYEHRVGTFRSARDPGTRHFRDFADWAEATLDPARHSRVAMFCTGGIRCEKASAWLLERGHAQVMQLDGGILAYLETVPPEQSRWEGDCFVFDTRVTVDDGLAPGGHAQCHACRAPLSEADRASPRYVRGIACPHCHGRTSEAQRAAFRERRRQSDLADARGEAHVGAVMGARETR